MVSEIAYLDWITGRPEQATHDLGSSNLRWGDSDPLQPAILEDTPEPEAGRTVQDYVADAYDVDRKHILVTAGASHANVLAFAAALDGPRQRVLVERPGYEPLWRTPELFGARIDRFDRPPNDGYPLDPERVTAAMDSDTALVAITNRHNPSGRRVKQETLAAIADDVADRGAHLIVDEVYAPFGPTCSGDLAFGGPTAAGLSGVVVTSSLTKFQGLDGLRIGWLIADESFVERARSALHYVPTLAEPSLELGRRALVAGGELSARSRSRIAANAEYLRSFVEDRENVSGPVFDGSNFAFLRYEHADGDAVANAAWAEDVLVVPGRFFDDKDRFRVSLAGDPEAMADALAALGWALDKC